MKKITLLFFSCYWVVGFAQNDYTLAENYYQSGAYEKATQLYHKLYQQSPFNTTFLKRLISCYQETSQLDIAEKVLTKRIRQNPKIGYLYVLLGYNHSLRDEKDLAQKYYDKALKSIDKNPNYGAATGYLFKSYNMLDEAILCFQKTMALKKNTDFNFQIAQIYGEKGDFNNMFTYYVNLIDSNEKQLTNVQRFIGQYLSDDSLDEHNVLFKKTLLRKAASNPKDSWNMLLSWLFSKQKEYTKAFIQEKAIYQRSNTNFNNIFSLGVMAFEEADYQSATTCFNFITSSSPLVSEQINAHVFLSKIAVTKNDPNSDSLFKTLFKTYGINKQSIPLQVEYAAYLAFKMNRPNEAIAVLEKAVSFSTSKYEKARIQLKLGDILVFTGRYNKALIYFSQIQSQLKNHELAQEARFKVAQTSYFKGDFAWSKAQLKVLKSATTQLIANDAVDLYITITDNEPFDTIPTGLKDYAKASLLSYQNKNTDAIKTLQEVIDNYKGQPIEDEALFKQAALYHKEKKYLKAIANYQKIIALDPSGILVDDAYFNLAALYHNELNNKEKALENYQKIIFDYPSSIFLVTARNNYRTLRGDVLAP